MLVIPTLYLLATSQEEVQFFEFLNGVAELHNLRCRVDVDGPPLPPLHEVVLSARGETKISQLGGLSIADENVLQFDVVMRDLLVVQVIHRATDLLEVLHLLVEGELVHTGLGLEVLE